MYNLRKATFPVKEKQVLQLKKCNFLLDFYACLNKHGLVIKATRSNLKQPEAT
jgi:hypothetical protein